MSADNERAIRAWLALIEETDSATVSDVLIQCQTDADARQYFTGRAAAELPTPEPLPDEGRTDDQARAGEATGDYWYLRSDAPPWAPGRMWIRFTCPGCDLRKCAMSSSATMVLTKCSMSGAGGDPSRSEVEGHSAREMALVTAEEDTAVNITGEVLNRCRTDRQARVPFGYPPPPKAWKGSSG
jgi:hypothetical protein